MNFVVFGLVSLFGMIVIILVVVVELVYFIICYMVGVLVVILLDVVKIVLLVIDFQNEYFDVKVVLGFVGGCMVIFDGVVVLCQVRWVVEFVDVYGICVIYVQYVLLVGVFLFVQGSVNVVFYCDLQLCQGEIVVQKDNVSVFVGVFVVVFDQMLKNVGIDIFIVIGLQIYVCVVGVVCDVVVVLCGYWVIVLFDVSVSCDLDLVGGQCIGYCVLYEVLLVQIEDVFGDVMSIDVILVLLVCKVGDGV